VGVARRKGDMADVIPIRQPAVTPQDRENQLVSLAFDVAEQQMRAGTASAQVITHYLKLGSSRERFEQQKIELEGQLLAAKKELMESQQRSEELFGEALKAMRTYTGEEPADEDFDDVDF
jgi:hypothetical protein